jgi:hypothetical protein
MTTYHKHYTQRVPSDPNWRVNCTAYCGAMMADDITLGGLLGVSGAVVRAASDEPHPDPASPGLNLQQVDTAIRKAYRVSIANQTGKSWSSLAALLRSRHRILLQIDYASLGGYRAQANGDFGHAIVLVEFRDGGKLIYASDPLASTARLYPAAIIQKAATVFAHNTGLASGLWFANSRAIPVLA